MSLVEERVRSDRIKGTGSVLTAPELHSYLGRVFYNRRNKMNPYWNSILVAGYKDGEAYVHLLSPCTLHHMGVRPHCCTFAAAKPVVSTRLCCVFVCGDRVRRHRPAHTAAHWAS